MQREIVHRGVRSCEYADLNVIALVGTEERRVGIGGQHSAAVFRPRPDLRTMTIDWELEARSSVTRRIQQAERLGLRAHRRVVSRNRTKRMRKIGRKRCGCRVRTGWRNEYSQWQRLGTIVHRENAVAEVAYQTRRRRRVGITEPLFIFTYGGSEDVGIVTEQPGQLIELAGSAHPV